LQLGAGSNLLKGWLNTDICPRSSESIYLDTTVSFPFDDCTFDYIFSEHHITTLSYNEGIFMLSECYRILKPGGRIRIAALNLEVLIGLYTSEKSGIQQQYIEWIIDKFLPEIKIYMESFVINNAFYNWEHKFIYDPPTLKNLMEKIGFIDVSFYSPGESKDENFQGVEYHGKSVGNEAMNRFETMVLEAKRPL
jgi:predicted SAM-dependent methyltransferase